MKKRHFIILILLAIIAVGIYKYIYQNHRNIETEDVAFVVSSYQISKEFNQDLKSAESKYLNQTIEVSGITSEIENKTLTLNEKIFCLFATELNNINTTKNIKIKGRVIGYDDLLEQVKLDQCSVLN